MAQPIGLIAGQGRLPVLTAAGIRSTGQTVACVGLTGQHTPELPDNCDQFARAGIIRIGRWIRLLRRWGVDEAVMIGRVRKSKIYQPLRLIRQLPDWRAARLWYRVLRHDRRNTALLGAVADELERGGIKLIDSTKYITSHLAHEGTMTYLAPSVSQMSDIEFGWPICQQLSRLDIGQSIAVREGEVIAVEAMEGTDALIQRAGQLCPTGKWTLLKRANPNHDMRFDVPTVGPQTIKNLSLAGATCLAVETSKVILVDKPQLIQLADHARIPLIGLS